MRATTIGGASALAVLLLATVIGVASAHGQRNVGDYVFTVGFFAEPAFEGEANGVDLRVRDAQEEPVEGVQETLQVEVRYADGEDAMTLPLRTVFGQPGRYTADFVPTAPGQYSFRFLGTVGDLDVDETFTSEVDSFGNVQPIADLQFPERLASGREVQAAVTGASEAAADADDAAAAATTRANIALGVGAVGLLAGIGALTVAGRRRSG